MNLEDITMNYEGQTAELAIDYDLTEEQIAEYLPSLKAVFYAAGSVQAFARPFLNRGIQVFSAWAANAVPVAEYTVAQIILAGKGFYAPYGGKVGAVNEEKLCYYVRGAAWDDAKESWGSAVITNPVSVKEMHAWRKENPDAFIAAISE